MTKKIFTLLIALITLSFVLPTTVRANTAIELIDQNFQGISISVYGSVLRDDVYLQRDGCSCYECRG